MTPLLSGLEAAMHWLMLAWIFVCAGAALRFLWLMVEMSQGMARARETLARSMRAGAAAAPVEPPPSPAAPAQPVCIVLRVELVGEEVEDGEEWKRPRRIDRRRPSPLLDDLASRRLLRDLFGEAAGPDDEARRAC